jgi:hypothetical protein
VSCLTGVVGLMSAPAEISHSFCQQPNTLKIQYVYFDTEVLLDSQYIVERLFCILVVLAIKFNQMLAEHKYLFHRIVNTAET